jgi:hypothetical protein
MNSEKRNSEKEKRPVFQEFVKPDDELLFITGDVASLNVRS